MNQRSKPSHCSRLSRANTNRWKKSMINQPKLSNGSRKRSLDYNFELNVIHPLFTSKKTPLFLESDLIVSLLLLLLSRPIRSSQEATETGETITWNGIRSHPRFCGFRNGVSRIEEICSRIEIGSGTTDELSDEQQWVHLVSKVFSSHFESLF